MDTTAMVPVQLSADPRGSWGGSVDSVTAPGMSPDEPAGAAVTTQPVKASITQIININTVCFIFIVRIISLFACRLKSLVNVLPHSRQGI